MADQRRVRQASSALGELHREMLHGRSTIWDFAAAGNAFRAAEREVQVAALEAYNRELRDSDSPELQISAADFANLF